MITNLKPYPVMKDSGVEWLGEVPEHWEVRRLKTLARLIMGQSPSSEDCSSEQIGPPFLQGCAEFGSRHPKPMQFCRAPSKISSQGAILMSVRAPVGRLNIADQEYGIGRGLCAIVPNEKLFHTSFARYELDVIGHGFAIVSTGSTYDAVSVGDVGVQPSVLPPLPEQTAIVRFLDYADRRIRRYIRAKQKLIGLLEEQKQAIIHQAVTRGLDPDVPLKPSGVEWLGEVPEHWEVRRVKQVAQILRGKFTHRPRNDPSLYDGLYPFIQTGEVARADKSIQNYRQTLNKRGLAVSKMFPAGTLVMTIAANIGDVAVLDFEACFPDSIVGFTPRSGIERDYLYYVFRAMKPELLREAPINTQGNLNVDRIGSREVGLPPAHEQQSIVVQIETSTLGLNTTITRTNREISLLREYRTRLIADVVTGKLDVREAAASLPEETEDSVQDSALDEVIEADLPVETAEHSHKEHNDDQQ